MHIALTKGKHTIEFDCLCKYLTGKLIRVKIKDSDDTGAVASTSQKDNLMMSHDVYHLRLMLANDEVLMKTGQKIGWEMNYRGNKSPCISCAMGK